MDFEEYWKSALDEMHGIDSKVEFVQSDFQTGYVECWDMNCPPSSQFAIYNKIKSKKQHIIYPDFQHENIPDFEDKTYQFLSKL